MVMKPHFLSLKPDCIDISRINTICEQHGVTFQKDQEILGYYRLIGDENQIKEALPSLDELTEIEWICYLDGRALYNATPGAWAVFLD